MYEMSNSRKIVEEKKLLRPELSDVIGDVCITGEKCSDGAGDVCSNGNICDTNENDIEHGQ